MHTIVKYILLYLSGVCKYLSDTFCWLSIINKTNKKLSITLPHILGYYVPAGRAHGRKYVNTLQTYMHYVLRIVCNDDRTTIYDKVIYNGSSVHGLLLSSGKTTHLSFALTMRDDVRNTHTQI